MILFKVYIVKIIIHVLISGNDYNEPMEVASYLI